MPSKLFISENETRETKFARTEEGRISNARL